MWFKSAAPAALLASAFAYGVANKNAIINDADVKTEKAERRLSLEAKKEKARETIVRQMVTAGIPGLSVGVSVNGGIEWREGFGFANLESGSRCTEDTVMRIASISKPITAAITARLVQDGRLDLDSPIQKYLPNFPAKNSMEYQLLSLHVNCFRTMAAYVTTRRKKMMPTGIWKIWYRATPMRRSSSLMCPTQL